jgi:hypothetical protein
MFAEYELYNGLRLIYAMKALLTDPYNGGRFATWKLISSLRYQMDPVIDRPSHAPSHALGMI